MYSICGVVGDARGLLPYPYLIEAKRAHLVANSLNGPAGKKATWNIYPPFSPYNYYTSVPSINLSVGWAGPASNRTRFARPAGAFIWWLFSILREGAVYKKGPDRAKISTVKLRALNAGIGGGRQCCYFLLFSNVEGPFHYCVCAP